MRAGLTIGEFAQLTQLSVRTLRRYLQPPQQLAVELRAETARTVAAITGTVNRSDLARWYNQAIAELGAALAGQQMTGPPGAYVTDHALAVAGPVREAYLVGPRDTADQDSWRTEIGWPIFRVSPI